LYIELSLPAALVFNFFCDPERSGPAVLIGGF
jgi:hypothetical protein